MAIMLIKISARMVFVSFIGLHLSSGTSSLWTIPDLFSDNSLQFIVRYDKNTIHTSDHDPHIFTTFVQTIHTLQSYCIIFYYAVPESLF